MGTRGGNMSNGGARAGAGLGTARTGFGASRAGLGRARGEGFGRTRGEGRIGVLGARVHRGIRGERDGGVRRTYRYHDRYRFGRGFRLGLRRLLCTPYRRHHGLCRGRYYYY